MVCYSLADSKLGTFTNIREYLITRKKLIKFAFNAQILDIFLIFAGEHFIPVEKEKEEQPEKVATPKKETESPNFQEQDSNSVPMTSATPEADEKSRDVKESSEKMSNFQEECLKFQKRRETKVINLEMLYKEKKFQ